MNVGTFVAVHLATQMAAQEKRVCEQLQRSGAQSSGSAMRLQLESKADEAALARLVKKGRVIDVGNGSYFLSEVAPQSDRSRVVVIACILLLAALGVALSVMIATR